MTVKYNFRQQGFYPGQATRFGSDLDKTYLNPKVSQQSTTTITTPDATNGWVTRITNTTTGEFAEVTYDGDAAAANIAANLAAAWNGDGNAVQLATADAAAAVTTFLHEGEDTYTVVTTPQGIGAATDAVTVTAGSIRAYHGRWAARTATASIDATNFNHLVDLAGVAAEQLVGIVRRPDGHQQTRDDTDDYFGAGDVPVRDRGSIAVQVTTDVKPGDDVWAVTAAGVDQGKSGSSGDVDMSAFCKWRSVTSAGGIAELEYDLKTNG